MEINLKSDFSSFLVYRPIILGQYFGVACYNVFFKKMNTVIVSTEERPVTIQRHPNSR